MSITFTNQDRARWEQKLRPQPSGCVWWGGAKNKQGYGRFRVGDGVFLAHRLAYTLHHGDIPDGMLVLHGCPGAHTIQTRSCVNPLHLRPGTAQDNGIDKVMKGSFKGILIGEKNGRAKLTDAEVMEIHRLVEAGERQAALAARFNVTQTTISAIHRGRTRSHLGFTVRPLKQRGPSGRVGLRLKGGPTPVEITHFKQHCGQQLPTGCVRWNGAIDRAGYGVLTWRGKGRRAHRFAYLLAHGWLPSGRDIAHTCADAACVSPGHLVAMTRKRNMANKTTRQRISQSNSGRRHHQILTDDQIRSIKERFRDAPKTTAVEIARDLGGIVVPETVANIRKGKTGRHVVVEGFTPAAVGKPPADAAMLQQIYDLFDAGQTQRQIAAAVGRSQAGISKILAGRRRPEDVAPVPQPSPAP